MTRVFEAARCVVDDATVSMTHVSDSAHSAIVRIPTQILSPSPML